MITHTDILNLSFKFFLSPDTSLLMILLSILVAFNCFHRSSCPSFYTLLFLLFLLFLPFPPPSRSFTLISFLLINLKGYRHSRDYLPIRCSYHSVLQVKNVLENTPSMLWRPFSFFLSPYLSTYLPLLQVSLYFLTSSLPHLLPIDPSNDLLPPFLPSFTCMPLLSNLTSSHLSSLFTSHLPLAFLSPSSLLPLILLTPFSHPPRTFLSPSSHLSLTTHNS